MKAYPTHKEEGMELRDYFAAKIMQSLIQASTSLNVKSDDESMNELAFDSAIESGVAAPINMHGEDSNGQDFQYTWIRYYAEEAYWIANAMMQARKEIKE
jgi:hypothetical protein